MDRGKRIKAAREAKKLTQEELGVMCGTTKQTIFKYESGIVTNIPTDKLEKIADALDVTPSYLMGWEEALLAELTEESQSGRTAAKEEIYRLFGEGMQISDLRVVGEKTAVLFYRAFDRLIAPEFMDIISSVEDLKLRDIENIRMIIRAYLNADAQIKEIVNTALRPYKEKEAIDALIG